MSDLPKYVRVVEEGPREGFQIEGAGIPTDQKIKLIDALSQTGLSKIQVCSFVSPRLVPGWADADVVAENFTPKDGVSYSALWFNEPGLQRALKFKDKFSLTGSISLSASEKFSQKNLNRTKAENLTAMRQQTAIHLAAGLKVDRISVMAAFGCNFEGDVSVSTVVSTLQGGMELAAEHGAEITDISLADTMGWATPVSVEKVVSEVRDRWPDPAIRLHLHNTRGLGIANAYAGLRCGVSIFDSSVGGLGGCPFAGQKNAPGNIATEELVHLCHELNVETGVDLESLLEVGLLAEKIVNRHLPSEILRGGGLKKFRRIVELPCDVF